MRIMRKLVLFALACVFVLSACTAAEEEIVPEFNLLDNGVTDFEGKEFVVAQEQQEDPDVIYYYTPDSLYYDLVKAHISKIEKEHNLKLNFTMQYGNESTFSNQIMSGIFSGIKVTDFVLLRGSNLNMQLAQAGVFYPISNVPDIIDLSNSAKYGPINILECCMANGEVYGVIPNYWPLKSNDGNMGVLVMINENIIARYGLDDPRDMYEQNTWKLSAFENLMPVYHINDGTNEIKALTANTRDLARGFLAAYRIGNIYEKDGEILSSIENPDLVDAINWGLNFISAYKDDYTLRDDWNYSQNLAAGESTLAFGETSYLLDLARIGDNYGFVPFPVADKYDCKDIQMTFSTYPTFSIFGGVDNPEDCARLIDILFEEIDGVTKEQMIDSLFRTMFFDERDARLYTELYKNGVYDYFGIGGNLQQKIETSYTGRAAQEVINSVAESLDKIFVEKILPNYEGMQRYN